MRGDSQEEAKSDETDEELPDETTGTEEKSRTLEGPAKINRLMRVYSTEARDPRILYPPST